MEPLAALRGRQAPRRRDGLHRHVVRPCGRRRRDRRPAACGVAVPGAAVGTYTSTVELRAGARKRILTVEHRRRRAACSCPSRVIDLGAVQRQGRRRRRSRAAQFRGGPDRGDRRQRRQSLAEHRAGAAGGWTVARRLAAVRQYVGSVSVQSGPDRVTVPVRYVVEAPPAASADFAVDAATCTLASHGRRRGGPAGDRLRRAFMVGAVRPGGQPRAAAAGSRSRRTDRARAAVCRRRPGGPARRASTARWRR